MGFPVSILRQRSGEYLRTPEELNAKIGHCQPGHRFREINNLVFHVKIHPRFTPVPNITGASKARWLLQFVNGNSVLVSIQFTSLS